MDADTIVFDLDGTLVDTAPDLILALNYTLGLLGFPPAPEERVRHLVGHGVAPLIRSSVPDHLYDEVVAKGRPIFIEYYHAHIAVRSRLYPGAPEAIFQLRQEGHRLAVCTNKAEGLARELLRTLDVIGLFDAVIGGDTCATCKPAAEPFLKAVADAGGSRGLMVGDSIVDANTARDAGAAFVAVSFGYCDRPVHELGADAVINSFSELPTVLQPYLRTSRTSLRQSRTMRLP